jgi:hypothetical protein
LKARRERETERERGENVIQCLKNTALLFYFSLLISLARQMERERAAAAAAVFFGFPEWMQNSKLEGNILHYREFGNY